jgi:hypothetical protein
MADLDLTTLIGTRLYPGFAPQDAELPFVIYYEFANPIEQVFGNAIALERPRIQYSVYGLTFADCLDTVEALKGALVAFTSPIVFEDERAYHDVTTSLYRRDLDARIPHV